VTGDRMEGRVPTAAAGEPTTGHRGDGEPGARSGGTLRQRRKTETRDRLLTAASQLFAENGYDQTSYSDIALLAGVARQTVFNYFPRKEDFARAWGARRRAEVDEVLASAPVAGQPAVSRLVLMLRVLADSYERFPAEGRVFTIAWVKWGGPVLEEPMLADQFAAVIADGQRTGEIREDVDANTAGQLIRAAYFDALWRWAAPDRSIGAPSLFSAMLSRLELVLAGLSAIADREALRRSVHLALAIENVRHDDSKGR
jgi:TetR/AcrR family transcriptional regulator, cholesterol catabolism regulator